MKSCKFSTAKSSKICGLDWTDQQSSERERENNLKIEYSKKTVKYINSVDKRAKKLIPETVPEPDEIEAIWEGREDRAKNGTVPHDAINWD
ncbi:MAG: hypothetical protein K2I07_05655 [Lachnospiraceae bacterium]|nr:hypothetical protein [Lachnospiraceae bacterium]